MTGPGKLFLIPATLGGEDAQAVLPAAVLQVLARLDFFIVENPKTARHFLKSAGYPRPLRDASFVTLNEHTPPEAVDALLAPVAAGHDCAVLSEAGCPAVADPGADLVRRAHAKGIRVVPLVGPSAILLALMASGMNGQRFVFHGYLPVAAEPRRNRLKDLETAARHDDATQIFIEAPYRNHALLQAILESCRDDTLLCLATDLTLPTETVVTRPVAAWKKKRPDIDRRPTVFLLYRSAKL